MNLRQFFWKFHRPYKIYIIFFVFFSSLLGLHGIINSYFTKRIIDALTISSSFFWPAVFMIVNFEIFNLCWRGINWIHIKTLPTIKSNVISYCFDYVHSHSHRFFQNTFSGSIANNIEILSANIERITKIIAIRLIRGSVQLIGALIGMSFIHPIFSYALLIWTASFVAISIKFSKKVSLLSHQYAESQSNVTGKIVDSFANFLSVRLFSQTNQESYSLGESLASMRQRFQRKESFLLKFYFFQGFSITCLIAFIIYFLIQLKTSNQISVGAFVFIMGVVLLVTENVWSVMQQIDQLNDSIGSCDQSLKAIFTANEITDKPDAKPLELPVGKIVFDQVAFSYKETEPLFSDLSVTIMPKEKVGLVGYSGSGKSTFINLILRFYDVISGQVLIDEQNVLDVTQKSLREAFSVIPQDPILFDRRLMDNIRYSRPNASDGEVIEAAKRAHIHEFISGLSFGYNTLPGEHGIKLSGGQRQRIAIARAILKNAPILILDEATSQLDSITEKEIQNSFEDLMRDKTTIVIAHRLSTLLRMDRLLVFAHGKIVEEGTHEELIHKEGVYRSFWDTQVGELFPKTASVSSSSNQPIP
ncbi:MAG: putative multidrug export ATP-binding/permease protein [Chlamydiae bacterium]|nr:putative multidrug export ATP-binding/permease protein [Chlamydiota bacterium]